MSAPCLPLSGLLALALLPVATRAASLSYTEQMPVQTFAALREVERSQMRIAQKRHFVATFSRADLLHMAEVKKDDKRRLLILEDLVYRTGRNDETRSHAESASRKLASLLFHKAKDE